MDSRVDEHFEHKDNQRRVKSIVETIKDIRSDFLIVDKEISRQGKLLDYLLSQIFNDVDYLTDDDLMELKDLICDARDGGSEEVVSCIRRVSAQSLTDALAVIVKRQTLIKIEGEIG